MGIESRMKAETCPVVQALYKGLRTKKYNNPYKAIAEFMSEEALKAIGRSQMGEEILLWASHKLAHNSKYLFWSQLLEHRHCFSENFIFSIWFALFIDCGNSKHQHPVEADGTENDFGWEDIDVEQLRNSVITSPLLIDSSTVLHRYCQAQKPGWKTMRYLRAGGRQWRTLPGWAGVRSDIEGDNVPGFEMGRVMRGGGLSFSLIAEILNNGANKIFRHLLENDLEELEAAVPLEEIACHVTAQFPDQYSVPVLELLEEVRPGIVGQFRDVFGQNLLWYGMHNPLTCWFHPQCKLTAYLLEKGCSPDAPTTVGLSWKFLTDSLTNEHKDWLWLRKFSAMKLEYEQLEEQQPNLWSKKR